MPFGEYTDFNDCVAQNQDQDNPEAYCAWLEHELTGAWPTVKGKDGVCLAGPIVFKDTHKRIVTAPVLVPGEADADGEIVNKEKIENVMFEWMENYRIIDAGHTLNQAAVPVESWSLRSDTIVKDVFSGEDIVLPSGCWMLSAKIKNDEAWSKVLSGEYRGFSITGVKKTLVENALKSDDVQAALKSITPQKTLLADLGDWIVVSVAMVNDPAVYKSKWVAIKSKAGSDDIDNGTLMEKIKSFFAGKEKEEVDEMTKEEIMELVQNAIKEALTEHTEAVKGITDRISALEDSAKKGEAESTSGSESETETETETESADGVQGAATDEAVKQLMEKMDALEQKLAAKARGSVNHDDGSNTDTDEVFKSKAPKRHPLTGNVIR